MRKKKATLRALLPLALILGAFAIGAPGAQAYTEHHYGGILLNPGESLWSGVSLEGEISGNLAEYTGTPAISVCQRTFDVTAGAWREGCGVGIVGSATNLEKYYPHRLKPYIKNNSSVTHTIHGYYYTY